MNGTNDIKQNLLSQALPFHETDIPYIHQILYTIDEAQIALDQFPQLNEEVPITVVDKRLMT